MKKASYILIGIILGVLLSVTTSVYGSQIGLVGRKVQSEVTLEVNGVSAGTVAIVDGKSFAPIRVIAETAGYEVGYQKGKVIMNNRKQESRMPTNETGQSVSVDPIAAIEQKIFDLNMQLGNMTGPGLDLKVKISKDPNNAELQAEFDEMVKKANEIKAEIAELEKQKAELELNN